jgi:hypothetical protein
MNDRFTYLNALANSGLDPSILPNPTTGTVFINVKHAFYLELYDLRGQSQMKLIKEQQVFLDNLASGLYFMKLWSREGDLVGIQRIFNIVKKTCYFALLNFLIEVFLLLNQFSVCFYAYLIAYHRWRKIRTNAKIRAF